MKLGYITPARTAYYVAIAIVAFVVGSIAKSFFGDGGATGVVVMLMWPMLVLDTKVAPPRISLIQPFLPGIDWIDLAVALALCLGFAAYTQYVGQLRSQSEFIVSLIFGLGVFFVIGILGLFRWQRWRGRR